MAENGETNDKCKGSEKNRWEKEKTEDQRTIQETPPSSDVRNPRELPP